MRREWQSGDVAMVGSELHGEERAVRRAGVWFFLDREGYGIDAYITPIRPLVVIDPGEQGSTDRVDVDRLDDLLWSLGYRADASYLERYTILDRALREFADPKPKPDEPTGLGAVVEDSEGGLWIRSSRRGGDPWRREGVSTARRTWHMWSDIEAIRVLSDGMTT